MAKDVPIGDPVRPFVPMRDPVAPGTDNAVKRFTGGRQLIPRLGGYDDIDKRIHGRIGNAGKILRPLCCGSLR